MMKRLLMLTFVLLTICVGAINSSAECKPEQLSMLALKLVKPYLSETIASRATTGEEQDEHVKLTFHLLDKIIEDTSSAGDEAISYLLQLYSGEHSGEELSCEAMSRGKRMLPLIRRYSVCLPKTGLEPLPNSLKSTGSLRKRVINSIEKGETCKDIE